MARRAEGWALYRDRRTGNYVVRFTHAGRRYGISTRETDPRKAKPEAARIYAEVVSGRRRGRRRVAAAALEIMLAEWVAAMEDEVPSTATLYEMYAFTHWEPYFGNAHRLTEASVADYMRARLRKVKATTVRKELSALRRFFAWAREQGFLEETPPVPSVPKRTTGKTACPVETVHLTAEQVEAILAELPERYRGARPRAFYTLMWETGLRRGTLWRLEVPRHYRKGRPDLTITKDIDKSRFDRVIDLTERARAVLDEVAPEEGLVFGERDLRRTLKAAGRRAGLAPEKAARLSNHDFRHARTTHLLEQGGSLLGVGYLVGHTNVSTTDRYAHARRSAARAALGLVADSGNQVATDDEAEDQGVA